MQKKNPQEFLTPIEQYANHSFLHSIFSFNGAWALITRVMGNQWQINSNSDTTCLPRGYYCLRLSTMTNETWRGKGLFDSHCQITVHHQRNSGWELQLNKNLEIGTDGEMMEECCLLAYISCTACFLVGPKPQAQEWPHP